MDEYRSYAGLSSKWMSTGIMTACHKKWMSTGILLACQKKRMSTGLMLACHQNERSPVSYSLVKK